MNHLSMVRNFDSMAFFPCQGWTPRHNGPAFPVASCSQDLRRSSPSVDVFTHLHPKFQERLGGLETHEIRHVVLAFKAWKSSLHCGNVWEKWTTAAAAVGPMGPMGRKWVQDNDREISPKSPGFDAFKPGRLWAMGLALCRSSRNVPAM